MAVYILNLATDQPFTVAKLLAQPAIGCLFSYMVAGTTFSPAKIGCQIWHWLVTRIPGYHTFSNPDDGFRILKYLKLSVDFVQLLDQTCAHGRENSTHNDLGGDGLVVPGILPSGRAVKVNVS